MADFAAGWDSFYGIVGAAAGALIGLQFVVITLIAERPPEDAATAGAAFATPTIVHFSMSLLLCALMRVPWPALDYPIASWGVLGAGGVIYTGVVAWRMREQTAYRPGIEGWAFHLALPAAAYALLACGALAALEHIVVAQFAVAASTLLLLFIGIHNAWDAVSYHVFVNLGGSRREAQQRKSTARRDGWWLERRTESQILNLRERMWLLFAFSGPVLWAASTHIDKFLVDRYFRDSDTAVLMIFTALIGVVMLPFIALFAPQTFSQDAVSILVMTLSGLLYMGAMLFYLRAIQSEEASVIAPLFQTSDNLHAASRVPSARRNS